jgi:hypothetical protein
MKHSSSVIVPIHAIEDHGTPEIAIYALTDKGFGAWIPVDREFAQTIVPGDKIAIAVVKVPEK